MDELGHLPLHRAPRRPGDEPGVKVQAEIGPLSVSVPGHVQLPGVDENALAGGEGQDCLGHVEFHRSPGHQAELQHIL